MPTIILEEDGPVLVEFSPRPGVQQVALKPEEQLRADLVELRTRDIRPGISGGAGLDETRNLVVGLVTERWNPAGSPEEDAAFDDQKEKGSIDANLEL